MTAPTGGFSSQMQPTRSMLQRPHGGQASFPDGQPGRPGEYSAPSSRIQEGFATGYAQQLQPQEISTRGRTNFSPNHAYERAPVPEIRTERPFLEASLSLRTTSSAIPMPDALYRDRASTDSPTRQFYPIPSLDVSSQSYPSLRPEVKSFEESTSSPRTERLPSFRQLSKIADGATDGSEQRNTPLPSMSAYPPSLVSQTSNPYFPGTQQSSPSAGYLSLNHQSPAGARGEGNENLGLSRSPATYPGPGPNSYIHRTTSFTSDKSSVFVTSLTSSSNDTTNSHHSSGTDGYSTTNTTPIESIPPMDGTPKPMLPLPPGMQHPPSAPGIFTCDYPGCTAAPFQTQYLLK